MQTPDRQASQTTPTPLDWRSLDGEAGHGDMLGGLNAGVGGHLGVPAEDEFDAESAPTSGYQHDLAAAPPATDAARNYHGRDNPAAV